MNIATALLGYLACIVGVVTSEWTEWSAWSSCSRSCDGGTSSQRRSCTFNSSEVMDRECNGREIRYRICGTRSCEGTNTDRFNDVCSALDDILVSGRTFKWSSDSSSSSSSSATGNDCYASCSPVDDGTVGPVYMARPDGTRCKLYGSADSDSAQSSHGVCLAGVCQAVGCDHVVGSVTALDRCGICGGDNSTCLPEVDKKQSQAVYQWREIGFSPCSASCGIGEESAIVSCRDVTNDAFVSDEYCRLSSTAGGKPHRVRACFGSNCTDDRAVWVTGEWQPCSRSCDGGRSFRSVYCILQLNDETFEGVDDQLCRHDQRPIDERKCNDFECPQWIAGQWSHCSVTCGHGFQQRAIVCKRTSAVDCVSSEKPPSQRPCRLPTRCPSHHAVPEIWNSESDSEAAYGGQDFHGSFDIHGQLIRDLERGNEVAEQLAPEHQPTIPKDPETPSTRKFEDKYATEPADSATVAPHATLEQHLATPATSEENREQHGTTTTQTEVQQATTSRQREFEYSEADLGERHSTKNDSSSDEDEILEMEFENGNSTLAYDESEEEFDGETDGETSEINYDEYDEREAIDGEHGEIEERNGAYRGGPPTENKKPTTIPSFVVSPWSLCGATCGVAIRRRKVVCKVLLEPSKIVQELPDYRCPGPRPKIQDYCALPQCPSKPETKTHSWMLTGYGPCSKTCGGGIQEGEINCIRIPQYFKVDKIRCLRQPVPARVKRPCNLQPCPPRWNPLPYGPCSVSCGGGRQVRQLQCVQDLHDQKTKLVPDAQCKDAVPPPTSAPCSLLPCPAKWVIGNWTKCSVTCGQGIQTRAVKCEQKLSHHQSVVVDDVSCWQQTDKPDTERTCEAGKCHVINNIRPKSKVILSENSNFVQLKPLASVSLTVGTNASLIAGSLIIIQCPLPKKSGRVKVVWTENDRPIDLKKRRRFRVDRHGSLRIRNSRVTDRGVYTCVAGDDAANVTIRFHAIEDALRELRTRMNFLREERKRASYYSEEFTKNFQSELKKLFAKTRRATYSGHFLISKMPTGVVPLQYVPFGWSPCSVECGGGGIQSRDVVCTILADDFFLEVDEGFCADRRLQKPIADRDCGFGKCPHWEPGSWGQCGDDDCVEVGVGERRREFHCVSPSGDSLDPDRCRGQRRPDDRERCRNDHCVAVWKASNWTQCSITCGGRGMKTRRLQCVWRQSKKPVVGSLCSFLQRPNSSKSCYATTPCVNTGCRDESRYCHMIPGLQMCRFPQYRQECCLSCSLVRASTSQQITSPNHLTGR